MLLCEYLSGDSESSELHEILVERAILALDKHGPPSEGMYPACTLNVDAENQRLTIGGVVLQPRDLRDILLSVDGRGLMLDMEGYDGKVPQWLYEQVLAPAGYVGKTPKVPGS